MVVKSAQTIKIGLSQKELDQTDRRGVVYWSNDIRAVQSRKAESGQGVGIRNPEKKKKNEILRSPNSRESRYTVMKVRFL